jgi:small subunit ribosomal protein S16
MVTIRLRRQGAKKSPFYRIVVADSRKPRDGAFVEILGHYNPLTTPESVVIDHDRLAYWVGLGARPSDTVRTLIKRHPKPAEVAAEGVSA